ncbi:MAG TPA: YbaK/EbsC family protein [Stellaceae bacterium]|nr:YbaK/EbsC family protein [Stellaceae bacterium]
MPELPAAARRVESAARELGLAIAIKVMPNSTRTAAEAAAAVGTTVGQIVKSLVFKTAGSEQPVLFLVSGDNRLNEKAVGERIGDTIVQADADFVRQVTGFAIGGIPPFGHATRLRTYFDENLLQYEIVWAAAGTPNCVFAIAPRALRGAADAHPIPVK